MDFCNECGSKTDPDWVFCRSCGNPLDSSEIEVVAVQPIASTGIPKVELISRGWDVVDIDATEADSGPELPADPLQSNEIITPLDEEAVEISVDEVTILARARESVPAGEDGDQDEAQAAVEAEPAIEAGPVAEAQAAIDTEPTIETKPTIEAQASVDTEPTIETKPTIEAQAAIEAEPTVEARRDRWDHLRPHGHIPGVRDPSRLPAKISQLAVLVAAFSAVASAVLYLLSNIQLEQFAAGDVSASAVRDVRTVAEASLLVTAGLAGVSLIMFVWWLIEARSRSKLRPGLAGLIAVPALLGGGALIGYFALLEKNTVADALTANSLIIIGLGLLMLASLATIRIVSRVEIRDRW